MAFTLISCVFKFTRLPSCTGRTGELVDYGCRPTFRCYGHQCLPSACVKLAAYPLRLTIAMDRAIRIVASGVLLFRYKSARCENYLQSDDLKRDRNTELRLRQHPTTNFLAPNTVRNPTYQHSKQEDLKQYRSVKSSS